MNLKIFTNTIDEKAVQQIDTLMSQPAFCNCKVRIMPDVHAGKGCTIGGNTWVTKSVDAGTIVTQN